MEEYAPEAILSIQLAEAGSTSEVMRDLTESRGCIMLSCSGLVKVLWVEAHV